MTTDEATRTLGLFGIPGDGDGADAVRGILARLLAFRAVSLGELQVARDVVGRARSADPHAYLFLAAMFVSLGDGNTAFNPANPSNGGGRLLPDACRRREAGGSEEEEDALGAAVAAAWPAALQAAESLRGDVVQEVSGLWYFSRYRDAVEDVGRLVRDRIGRSGDTLPDDALEAVARYRNEETGADEPLDDGQRRAVRAAVENTFTVVTGGPGTGKTTVLCSILRALFRTGLKAADVALAAPTGRAGRRMGEALAAQCAKAAPFDGNDPAARAAREELARLAGTTVHALLGGYRPNWTFNAQNPLPHRLVVVDECSMVDLLLMRSLLSALRKDCRLVLLGDKDQLPSVEAGAVLGDLAAFFGAGAADTGAFVELTESHRFKGRLKECAGDFNRGRSESIQSDEARLPRPGDRKWTDILADGATRDGCFFHALVRFGTEPDKAFHERADALLLDWARANGLGRGGALARKAEAVAAAGQAFGKELTDEKKALFDALEASRILTVVRRGPFGVEHANDLLLRERLGRAPAEPLVAGGIPVIVTRNTPSLNLFNGDVGVTVKGSDGVRVLFRRGKEVVSCPVALLPEHDLAYAITVHKSQGSEYGNVLVVLPNDPTHPLLSRQLVYTGITRAKLRAVILGTPAALAAAIRNEIKRDTGIVLASGAPTSNLQPPTSNL